MGGYFILVRFNSIIIIVFIVLLFLDTHKCSVYNEITYLKNQIEVKYIDINTDDLIADTDFFYFVGYKKYENNLSLDKEISNFVLVNKKISNNILEFQYAKIISTNILYIDESTNNLLCKEEVNGYEGQKIDIDFKEFDNYICVSEFEDVYLSESDIEVYYRRIPNVKYQIDTDRYYMDDNISDMINILIINGFDYIFTC